MLLRSLVKIPLSPPVEDDNGLSGSREAGSAIMVAEVRGDGVDVTKAKPKKGSVKFSLADVDPDEIVRRDLDNEDSEEEEDSDGEGEFVFLPSGTVCKKNETFRKTIPKLLDYGRRERDSDEDSLEAYDMEAEDEESGPVGKVTKPIL